jgi:hypothetical protein
MLVNDPRVLLVKDSIVSGGLGLAFIVSLSTSRPLMVSFATTVTGGDPAQFQQPGALGIMRRLSVIWGLGLIAEAIVRVALSFVLPPVDLLVVSPVLGIGVLGGLGLWTTLVRRAAIRSNVWAVAGAQG